MQTYFERTTDFHGARHLYTHSITMGQLGGVTLNYTLIVLETFIIFQIADIYYMI